MASNNADQVREYGFTAVPVAAEKLFEQAGLEGKEPPPVYPVSATPVPDTPVAHRIQAYVRSHLPGPTFNHSMRVYHYGLAIKQYLFPDWAFSDETYFLTCMLHDIGTTPENLRSTRLSFEFYGGLLALDVLRRAPESDAESIAPKAQAESVAEAVIRHQDLSDVGTITAVGQLVQLATIFDNTGLHSQLINMGTARDVIKHFPRQQWSSCFVRTVQEELGLKPWAHTTALGEEFSTRILGNKYAAEFERD